MNENELKKVIETVLQECYSYDLASFSSREKLSKMLVANVLNKKSDAFHLGNTTNKKSVSIENAVNNKGSYYSMTKELEMEFAEENRKKHELARERRGNSLENTIDNKTPQAIMELEKAEKSARLNSENKIPKRASKVGSKKKHTSPVIPKKSKNGKQPVLPERVKKSTKNAMEKFLADDENIDKKVPRRPEEFISNTTLKDKVKKVDKDRKTEAVDPEANTDHVNPEIEEKLKKRKEIMKKLPESKKGVKKKERKKKSVGKLFGGKKPGS